MKVLKAVAHETFFYNISNCAIVIRKRKLKYNSYVIEKEYEKMKMDVNFYFDYDNFLKKKTIFLLEPIFGIKTMIESGKFQTKMQNYYLKYPKF